MTQNYGLSVSGLACERDERYLFYGLALTLGAGEIVQVAGANGSGKTTLLRIIAGLSMDYTGEILWYGQPTVAIGAEFYADLLYIGHQPGVKTTLTAEENLCWAMGLHRNDLTRERIWEALAKVGLSGFEDIPCYQLSAGQNRRVALARLSLARQPLWILDEPFTALDRQGVADLEQQLLDHARAGGLVMVTTHHELALAYPGFRQLVLGEPL